MMLTLIFAILYTQLYRTLSTVSVYVLLVTRQDKHRPHLALECEGARLCNFANKIQSSQYSWAQTPSTSLTQKRMRVSKSDACKDA
jgi:hypothetical protein